MEGLAEREAARAQEFLKLPCELRAEYSAWNKLYFKLDLNARILLLPYFVQYADATEGFKAIKEDGIAHLFREYPDFDPLKARRRKSMLPLGSPAHKKYLRVSACAPSRSMT